MKNFFLGPRAPKKTSTRIGLALKSVLSCFFGASAGTLCFGILLAIDDFSFSDNLLGSAVLVFAAHLWTARFSGYSPGHAVEMSIGGSVFYVGVILALYLDSAWWWLCVLGVLIHLRPYLEGPDPDGWAPFLLQEEKEKLKSRRE